jgi:hypothetical protein
MYLIEKEKQLSEEVRALREKKDELSSKLEQDKRTLERQKVQTNYVGNNF